MHKSDHSDALKQKDQEIQSEFNKLKHDLDTMTQLKDLQQVTNGPMLDSSESENEDLFRINSSYSSYRDNRHSGDSIFSAKNIVREQISEELRDIKRERDQWKVRRTFGQESRITEEDEPPKVNVYAIVIRNSLPNVCFIGRRDTESCKMN